MREKLGPPEDNHQGTRENLRSLNEQIINEIQSQMLKKTKSLFSMTCNQITDTLFLAV